MTNDEAATLCCLLWAREGAQDDLSRYEDAVFALLPAHGGELLSRVVGAGAEGAPCEVQLYRFASQGALDAFLLDPRRLALSGWRDRVVERTELFPVELRAVARPGPQADLSAGEVPAVPATAPRPVEHRAVFDAEITFSNGGGLQAQGFRVDVSGPNPSDEEIGRLFVASLDLLMTESVTLSNVAVIEEPHKGTRGGPSDPHAGMPDGPSDALRS